MEVYKFPFVLQDTGLVGVYGRAGKYPHIFDLYIG